MHVQNQLIGELLQCDYLQNMTTISWVSKDLTTSGEPIKIVDDSTGTGNAGITQSMFTHTPPTSPTPQPIGALFAIVCL